MICSSFCFSLHATRMEHIFQKPFTSSLAGIIFPSPRYNLTKKIIINSKTKRILNLIYIFEYCIIKLDKISLMISHPPPTNSTHPSYQPARQHGIKLSQKPEKSYGPSLPVLDNLTNLGRRASCFNHLQLFREIPLEVPGQQVVKWQLFPNLLLSAL